LKSVASWHLLAGVLRTRECRTDSVAPQLAPGYSPVRDRKLLGATSHWRRSILSLGDGNVPLTNNRRERELRKLVLERRNWPFVWKDIGSERTASILTILATCVSHGLNPRPYLHAVTEGLLLRGEPVETLLPDRLAVTRPDVCLPDFDEPSLPD
jgi:hypothetical protein